MYLIVGAGLSGAVIAQKLASEQNIKVLVIDRRNHIAGNLYDYVDKNGILIHKYGPHIFHTNNKNIWDYLSQFTKWHFYQHRVKAIVEGLEITLPFNLDNIYELFPRKLAENIENKLIKTFGYGKKIPILSLLRTSDNDIKFIGKYIYENIYLGYTLKQWGLKPEDLDDSVTARVPIYISRDNRYFQDKYQGIPENGYTKMIENMLNHPNIEINLDTEFSSLNISKFKKIIFTGMIDEYYNFKFGKLSYRSLKFDFRTIDSEFYQSVAQVNYPNNYDFTRITEFKYFYIYNRKVKKTTIAIEYPEEFKNGFNEPYYPILSTEMHKIYSKYKRLSENDKKTIFVGRLANYIYLNMDQAVKNALNIFNSIIND